MIYHQKNEDMIDLRQGLAKLESLEYSTANNMKTLIEDFLIINEYKIESKNIINVNSSTI